MLADLRARHADELAKERDGSIAHLAKITAEFEAQSKAAAEAERARSEEAQRALSEDVKTKVKKHLPHLFTQCAPSFSFVDLMCSIFLIHSLCMLHLPHSFTLFALSSSFIHYICSIFLIHSLNVPQFWHSLQPL